MTIANIETKHLRLPFSMDHQILMMNVFGCQTADATMQKEDDLAR